MSPASLQGWGHDGGGESFWHLKERRRSAAIHIIAAPRSTPLQKQLPRWNNDSQDIMLEKCMSGLKSNLPVREGCGNRALSPGHNLHLMWNPFMVHSWNSRTIKQLWCRGVGGFHLYSKLSLPLPLQWQDEGRRTFQRFSVTGRLLEEEKMKQNSCPLNWNKQNKEVSM